ncbi:MAG: ferric reductase-like transmembrane domain-containing protein [Promicromonosporaceae bacterium]|nr:ferric reductase-like transmembrane domain-containing protein [Promicromonosporaceae bacterium]
MSGPDALDIPPPEPVADEIPGSEVLDDTVSDTEGPRYINLATQPLPPPLERPPANPIWRIITWILIGGVGLLLAIIWITGGAFHTFTLSTGDALIELGRLTGLIAAAMLLFQVVLMARVPVFEHGLGHQWIVNSHKKTGFWLFWLVIAHVVFLVIGYSATGLVNPFRTFWEFIVEFPGGLLATAAFIALIAVVVLSIRRVRKKLRYENWHLLHLYGYLAAGLALPHQIWAGASFYGRRWAELTWWTLWGVALLAVILFRIVRPIARSFAHDLRVQSAVPDGTRGVLITISGKNLAGLHAEPGQFFIWRFLSGYGWTQGHPFSLAIAPEGDTMTIAVAIVGGGTERLLNLKPGTRVIAEGPFGELTGALRTRPGLIGIAAGAGIAPVFAILEGEQWSPGEAVLITRDDDADRSLMTDQIAEMVETRGLNWIRMDGAPPPGFTSWLPASCQYSGTQFLARAAEMPLPDYDVYLCGPPPWMEKVEKDLLAAGEEKHLIHSESFAM